MPAKRKTTRRPRMMRGHGFFGDVWNGIKSGASAVGNFVKDNKLISTGLSLVPDGRAQIAGKVAGAVGLGRKRRMRGRGAPNVIFV